MACPCIYPLSPFLCQQLSIAAQCCIHNSMQTPGWRHLLLYGSCWIFHQIAIFRVSLHISSAGWEVREDALEVRGREWRAEDEQKEDTNSAKSRCRERWKEEISKCSQFSSCSISCIPSLPRLPGPPATPAEVPFASPRAHSAGSAW